MRVLPLTFLACAVGFASAQTPCSSLALHEAANRVRGIQEQLKHVQVEELDDTVPPAVSDQLVQLKNALTTAADAVLSCAGRSVSPVEIQNQLANALHANPPEPASGSIVSKDDHRFDEALGSYGHNLRVQVRRPPNFGELLEVEFSTNIECGEDHMLLIYAPQNSAWKRQLRWQAPPLKEISDAFGDFFFSAILSAPEGGNSGLRVVVAHGTPWCTSRFSAFDIDILALASDSQLPKLLWHTKRGYSRGDFDARLKSSGDTFELQVNDIAMDPDAFERHVVYRYQVGDRGEVHRIQPIATNARGFVEEWLLAPWSEAEQFLAQPSLVALQAVHEQLNPPTESHAEFVSHRYGPVRACSAPKTFQVQIDSTLKTIVPGKPGRESQPLQSRYFHVRELANGYLMVSAPAEADPACNGPDLMSATSN